MDGHDNTPGLACDVFTRAADVEPAPRLEIDVERYQNLLDDPDLDPAQREQILRALWDIIIAFVDLGFGVHPMQQACGQLGETDIEAGNAADDAVHSKDQP